MRRMWVGLACSLALGGCASTSSFLPDLSGGPATVQVRTESEPAGAEARASTGQACRTPCTLAMPAAGNFTVTFTSQGFAPQTVPVKVRAEGDPRADPNSGYGTQVDPNPVSVALEPAAPPKPVRRKPVVRRRPPSPPRTARSPDAAPPPAAAAPAPPPTAPGAPPPLPSGGFQPPPGAPPSQSAYPPLPAAR